jgi:hypothetical protein
MTSTGSRFHSTGNENSDSDYTLQKGTDTVNFKEDFDISPFKTNIIISDSVPPLITHVNKDLRVWYNYDSVSSSGNKIARQTSGYRVLVLTTDNLDEANNLKSEIYFKTNQKPVYISFDPPFYKVEAGDFTDISQADELSFKLNQLGYANTKIIRDTINISR